MSLMEHITVLLKEAVQGLALQPDSLVVDATLGAGGHTREILSYLGEKGRLIALDADQAAIDKFQSETSSVAKLDLVCENFVNLAKVLQNLSLGSVDAILADLGWRTDQFLASGRGFSFNDEQGLVMTYGNKSNYDFDATEIINTWSESSIADIIYGYGEEPAARKIAAAIVRTRTMTPITTAKQLSDVIQSTIGSRHATRIHPATKTFQALRIAVNDELQVLDSFITTAFDALRPSGRLAIISFHSLEDRIVKYRFRTFTHDQQGELLTKKPITPSQEERLANPRSRSAKLRIISKL
jgi:16S rRNA (cytosine1402-N4)-methyltransferase